ncbi:UDP-N-acetylmuramate--L-alanine ligase [Flavobacteriales bacterium]|nr:UDP-N-acetylmuramate--L-alanine ligase [Flavobacteriales bacterium]
MRQRLYFLGIGGIGMSALARWFHAQGAQVAGYDRTATTLTQALQQEGIAVDHSGAKGALPESLREDMAQGVTDRWTIVWTPAIPNEFPLLQGLQHSGFPLYKRSEILGKISQDRPLLAVAGTHGKTTTSTLLAHILHHGGAPVEAFLGGIALGQDSNLLLASLGDPHPWMVAEADEYDRSFLTLYPTSAAITSIEPDHLDIYGTHDQMLKAFGQFSGQVKEGGLLWHADVIKPLHTVVPETQSLNPEIYGELPPNANLAERGWAAGYAQVGAATSGRTGEAQFMLHLRGHAPMQVVWRMPGTHNAANATAAAYLACRAGLDPATIPDALAAFPGVARRFEIKHKGDNKAIIDDYAHHPTEVKGAIAAARQSFPGRRLTGVFQPHLYSRTQDFMEGFAKALSALDNCILLPIYAARENPIPGVDTQGIGEKMVGCPVECPSEIRFLDALEQMDPEVLLFMGAGDLNRWIDPAWDRMNKNTTTS